MRRTSARAAGDPNASVAMDYDAPARSPPAVASPLDGDAAAGGVFVPTKAWKDSAVQWSRVVRRLVVRHSVALGGDVTLSSKYDSYPMYDRLTGDMIGRTVMFNVEGIANAPSGPVRAEFDRVVGAGVTLAHSAGDRRLVVVVPLESFRDPAALAVAKREVGIHAGSSVIGGAVTYARGALSAAAARAGGNKFVVICAGWAACVVGVGLLALAAGLIVPGDESGET